MNQKVIGLYETVFQGSHDISSEISLREVPLWWTGAKHVVRILPFYTHIASLTICKAKLGPEGMAEHSNGGFHLLRNLQMLALDENELGPIGAVSLSKVVSCFKNLKELWVSSMTSRPKARLPWLQCYHVCYHGIGLCDTCVSLDLDDNSIESEGILAILQSIPHNEVNLTLSFAYNRITSSSTQQLLDFIESCQGLYKINLTGNLFQEKDAKLLSEAMTVGEVSVT